MWEGLSGWQDIKWDEGYGEGGGGIEKMELCWWSDCVVGGGETVYGKGFWYDNSMVPNPHFEKLAKNSENAVASRTNNK